MRILRREFNLLKFHYHCVIGVAILLLLCFTIKANADNNSTPSYSRSKHNYSIPDVLVTTHNGETTKLATLLKNPNGVIVNFIFTSCSAICPMMTAIIAKVQSMATKDLPSLHLVSISIDPEHDTASRLAEYAHRYKAAANWHFLTGDLTEIQRIQQAFDADRGDKMNHATLTLFRTAPSQSWIRLEGIASAANIINEFKNASVSPAQLEKSR